MAHPSAALVEPTEAAPAAEDPAKPAPAFDRRLLVLAAIFTVGSALAIFAAFQARYLLTSIDGISYASIAQQYADGDWGNAFNAYWSPLYSWLAAPFLWLGASPLLALDLVTALAVIVAAGVGTRIVWRRGGRNLLVSTVFLVSMFIFGIGNLTMITPDMLVVAWVVVFAGTLMWADEQVSRDLWSRWSRWVVVGTVLGAVGAVGYFAKLFLVPVFVVSLVVWVVVRTLVARSISRDEAQSAARRLLATLVIAAASFALVAAPWVTAISVKYGGPTLGSSFSVNLASKFGPADGEAPTGPITLDAPPNDRAVSFGEDRTAQGAVTSGGETSVLARATYYATERIRAFPDYLSKLQSLAPFALLTVVGFLLVVIFRRLPYREYAPPIIAAVIWGVYFLGYALITSSASGGGNRRYYWPILVLSLMLAALVAPRVWRFLTAGRSRVIRILAGVLLALIPFALVWQHGAGRAGLFSGSGSEARWDYVFRSPHPSGYEKFATGELSSALQPGDRIVGENYRVSLVWAYYLGAQIYGRSAQHYDAADANFQQALRDSEVDYYLEFTPKGQPATDTSGIGPTVAQFSTRSTCDDTKLAEVFDECIVSVVEVAP